MSRQHYFFCINYIPSDAAPGLLAGRCISTLHGYATHHPGTQIGVSFPGWSDTTIGHSIAFVSIHKSQLEAFVKRAYFQVMETNGLFALSQVIKVPDSCSNVQFIRNQNVEKIFVGARKRILARVKRRAEERGEIFEPQIPFQTTDVGFFHCVFMQSISTGKNYVLFIQKRSCGGKNHGVFSSYGLSSNNIYTGYVPELTGVI